MADPKHPRHYDEAFKRQIVQSCESGKPSRETRAECDIARSTLQRWVQGIRDCVLSSAGVPFYRGWLSGLPVNCLPGYRRLVSSGFGCFVIA
ncbi:transposase [Bifidobacterium ruminantium]|uniref:Transposase n=2 Tax=Bifidobacterium ruminantium TaxID=78346 RepID=A0A087D326_BIFRU|nr:transposase [Bifidobacterium ruminantium]